jgi:hypothetical protein
MVADRVPRSGDCANEIGGTRRTFPNQEERGSDPVSGKRIEQRRGMDWVGTIIERQVNRRNAGRASNQKEVVRDQALQSAPNNLPNPEGRSDAAGSGRVRRAKP